MKSQRKHERHPLIVLCIRSGKLSARWKLWKRWHLLAESSSRTWTPVRMTASTLHVSKKVKSGTTGLVCRSVRSFSSSPRSFFSWMRRKTSSRIYKRVQLPQTCCRKHDNQNVLSAKSLDLKLDAQSVQDDRFVWGVRLWGLKHKTDDKAACLRRHLWLYCWQRKTEHLKESKKH